MHSSIGSISLVRLVVRAVQIQITARIILARGQFIVNSAKNSTLGFVPEQLTKLNAVTWRRSFKSLKDDIVVALVDDCPVND